MGELKLEEYDILQQDYLLEYESLSLAYPLPKVYNPANTDKLKRVKDIISKKYSQKVYHYIKDYISPERSNSLVFSGTNYKQIEDFSYTNVDNFISLERTNKLSNLNKYFRKVNSKLQIGGVFIGCTETSDERTERIFKNKRDLLTKILIISDFIVHRVLPKVKPFSKFYNFMFRKKVAAISKAELLGRLVYCGFEIKSFKKIDNVMFFIVSKKEEPQKNTTPSYGPLFRMRRIGKNGSLISVYKIRTMHAYSEYLQEYITNQNGYTELGKPANDFRLTEWGKLLRKYWLDEVLQIINVLKGEMSLVGVRPISQVRYNQFPEDMQIERIKYKPGCIPPYVALLMPNSKQNIEAERVYLKEKITRPIFTDFKYLYLAIYNILSGKIISA